MFRLWRCIFVCIEGVLVNPPDGGEPGDVRDVGTVWETRGHLSGRHSTLLSENCPQGRLYIYHPIR